MRKILEDFYFGNITPCEQQLTERLGESERTLLTELIKTQQRIDSITSMENFVMGFRLGIRIMAACMDEDDGNIQKIEL